MTDSAGTTLALLGVGYIGGSVALAARSVGEATRVVGFDPDAAALATARARGIIDAAAQAPEVAVAGAHLVVIGAPVAAVARLLVRVAPAVAPAAVVMDVGSVKEAIVRAGDAALPDGRFVGCHPMAGTERSGPEAADPDLFRDRTCFVCPGARTAAPAVGRATRFWQALGARVREIPSGPHDAAMAAVSHLPHVASFALAAGLADALPMLEQAGPAGAPTTSLRDTSRIAGSSPAVWRDIFLENARHLAPLVRALEGRVARLRAAIEAGDAADLEAVLVEGRATRERLLGGN